MKKEIIGIGLAICSLAAIHNFAQEEDKIAPRDDPDTKSSSATATAEETRDITTEKNGKKQRSVRTERRFPDGKVEIEEFDTDVAPGKKPAIRRRVQVIEDGEVMSDDVFEDGEIDVRPHIRVFPKEREMIIRRGPLHRELRVDLKNEFDDSEGRLADTEEPMQHLDEAIRHLKKAKLAEAAARLEGERAKLHARREADSTKMNAEMRKLRKERDALREEVRKLKEEVAKQRAVTEESSPGSSKKE